MPDESTATSETTTSTGGKQTILPALRTIGGRAFIGLQPADAHNRTPTPVWVDTEVIVGIRECARGGTAIYLRFRPEPMYVNESAEEIIHMMNFLTGTGGGA